MIFTVTEKRGTGKHVTEIREFRITEDMKGIIVISSKTSDGLFKLRGGYEEEVVRGAGNIISFRYNALLRDVMSLMSKGDLERVSRGRCQLVASAPFGLLIPEDEVFLLADESGVYPNSGFSAVARRVFLNTDHVSEDEWCSLRNFYSWESWFAKLKRVVPNSPDEVSSRGFFKARARASQLRSLSVAPVVFAGELWSG
jgi:hypothetical protein